MKLSRQLASEISETIKGVGLGEEFKVLPDSPLCSSLELFLPAILREKYPSWERESFDGIFPASARRIGNDEIKIFGIAILISDQFVTPFMTDVVLTSEHDDVRSARTFVGESGRGKLGISVAPYSQRRIAEQIADISRRVEGILWVYTSELGLWQA